MDTVNALTNALYERAQRIEKEQGYYFIGQHNDGTYYGVTNSHVKTRSSAARMLTDNFFVKNNIKAIKIKRRQSSK